MGQLTSLSAACPRTGGSSRYAGMTSVEAHDAFRREARRIRTVAIAALVVAAILCLGPGSTVDWALTAYLVVALADMAVTVVLLNRSFQGLLDISNLDCDPQKLIEVVSRLQADDKGGRSSNSLALAYATCCHNLGHDDDALQWLDRVRFRREPPTVSSTKGTVHARIALSQGDVALARQLRDQVAALGLRGAAASMRDFSVALIDADLALAEGDVDAARAGIERAAWHVTIPSHEVALEYHAALVEEALGDVDGARERMERVAANAGTLVLGDRSRAWIDSHVSC